MHTEDHILSMNTLVWEKRSPNNLPQITPLPDAKLTKIFEKAKVPSQNYEKMRASDLDPTLIAASKKIDRIFAKNPELKEQFSEYVNARMKIIQEEDSLLLATCGGLMAGALACVA